MARGHAIPSSRGRVLVGLFFSYTPPRLAGALGLGSKSSLDGAFRATGKTELAAMAARPFGKAGGAWPRLASRTAANEGHLIRRRANKIENKVVQQQNGPWSDGQDGEN